MCVCVCEKAGWWLGGGGGVGSYIHFINFRPYSTRETTLFLPVCVPAYPAHSENGSALHY